MSTVPKAATWGGSMGNQLNVVVYGRNLFGFDDATINQQQLEEMQESGFTTVILWPLHVDTNGDLFYHDSDDRDPTVPIVQAGAFNSDVYGYMPPLVSALKSDGSVGRVLFSIGSAGDGDYNNIKHLLTTAEGTETLVANLRVLAESLALDGYDLDFEITDTPDTTVKFSLLLSQ